MGYTLERAERRGDRARRRISTPSEQVEPTFRDGKIRVVCSKSRARDLLVKFHGFVEVSSSLPEPEVEAGSADASGLSHRERVTLAKSLGISGAHRKKSADLLDEILAVQSRGER